VLILSACVFGGRKIHLKLTNGAVTKSSFGDDLVCVAGSPEGGVSDGL